jgi:hypothetical protein
MTLDPDRGAGTIPTVYSESLRSVVTKCLSVADSDRPTAFDLLGTCISHSNWNASYVSPYGLLIASNFNSVLLSSWYNCRMQYEQNSGLTTQPTSLRNEPPEIIESALGLLSQKGKEGKEALRFFIAGVYFLLKKASVQID